MTEQQIQAPVQVIHCTVPTHTGDQAGISTFSSEEVQSPQVLHLPGQFLPLTVNISILVQIFLLLVHQMLTQLFLHQVPLLKVPQGTV